MIDLKSVNVSYGDRIILRDTNLSISAGDRVAVMGPSGSGKTTLLKLLAKIITKNSSKARVDGEISVTGKVGYMPQDSRDAVVPWRKIHKLVPDEAVLQELGLFGHKNKLPKHLSGGQMRRLALGHVLHYNKDIYLLDEPLTGLEQDLRTKMIQLIESRIEPTDILVFVTHYIEEADELAKSAIYVKDEYCQYYPSMGEFKIARTGKT